MPKLTEERRQYQRDYYDKNRPRLLEKQRERNRRNYQADPETHRARSKAWQDANPDRARELKKQHAARNREKINARSRDWYLNNKERASEQARKAKLARYGLTEEAYQAMVTAQDGLCGICRRPPKLHRLYVDHCHRTGAVRGLLCNTCNAAIGMLKDRRELLEQALRYLANNGSSGATSTTNSAPRRPRSRAPA